MSSKIYVSSSPHFNFKCSTQMIMGTVLIALLPEIIMGIVLFGMAALIRILVSVASCVLFEFLFLMIHQVNYISCEYEIFTIIDEEYFYTIILSKVSF